MRKATARVGRTAARNTASALTGRRIRPLLFAILPAPCLAACGSGGAPDTGSASSPTFVCDNSPVFGLESPLFWLATSGTALPSSRRIDGNAAVRLSGTAHTAMKSVPTCTPPATWGQLSLYVATNSTTAPATNTTVTVTFNSFLAGLVGAQVGSQQVTLAPNGHFTRVEFAVPPSIASKLVLGAADLGVSLAFDGSAAQDFIVDDLSLKRAVLAPVPGTGPLQTATIHVEYPPNADLLKIALLGQVGVAVSNNSKLVPDCDGIGSIDSVGAQATDVGVAALTGPVFSTPNVILKDLSFVSGDVTTAGTVTRGNLVTVTGQLRAGTVMTPVKSLDWQVKYNQGTSSVALPLLGLRTLAPGAYTAVTVPATAKLTLSSGPYYFDSLDVTGELDIVTDSGPVVVYVKNTVLYRGTVLYFGTPGQLVLVYSGTSPIFLQTPFDGFVVAPKSDVRLAAGLKPHAGAVFARTVLLDPFAGFAARNTFPILTASTGGADGGLRYPLKEARRFDRLRVGRARAHGRFA